MKGRGLFAWGIVLFTVGLLLFGAWLVLGRYGKPSTTVTVGASAFKTTVVADEAGRAKGLGGVTHLSDGTGMLFVFPGDGPQGIWMKDMTISLDIVWLDATKKVVNVERDVTPATYPKVYRSPKPARYVLEIPAGSATRAGIANGKAAVFDLPDRLNVE